MSEKSIHIDEMKNISDQNKVVSLFQFIRELNKLKQISLRFFEEEKKLNIEVPP